MLKSQHDLVVIGGGPAGLAAALSAHSHGVPSILLIERDRELGGILQQCIHSGFGLEYFAEELTGPEYAERFVELLATTNIQIMSSTMVTKLNPDKTLLAVNQQGLHHITARSVILAMGCRERTRGNLMLPGSRPAGIYTAGTAQRLVNLNGILPGRSIAILGSGDIGLIMARRLTLEGCTVVGVFEIMPYLGGLTRNLVQCLDDYNIPLHLEHTVISIHGQERVSGITVKNRAGEARFVPCDTVLLSVGLIPENELSEQAGVTLDPLTLGPKVKPNCETSVSGIFACGNVLQVHDLVDHVTLEAERAGEAAAKYLHNQKTHPDTTICVRAGTNIRNVVPQHVPWPIPQDLTFTARIKKPMEHAVVSLSVGNTVIHHFTAKHLRPGEMLRFKLPFSRAPWSGSSLTLNVEEK